MTFWPPSGRWSPGSIAYWSPPRRAPPLAFEIARFGAIVGLIGIEFGGAETLPSTPTPSTLKPAHLRHSHAIPNHYFPKATDLLSRRAIDADS
jgi:hypothetical protein